MVARVILSFDCEGKWGVADLLDSAVHRDLSDARLAAAYDVIVQLLDEFAMPATFAFVGAFAQPKARFREIEDGLREIAERAPNYLGPALFDLAHGSKQGWHGDWAVNAVEGAATKHEIALHGFSHVPWTNLDREIVQFEMALWRSTSGPVSDSLTFIYPRNAVSHTDLLAAAGFQGFRGARPSTTRLRSFASEFNVWASPDSDPMSHESIIRIPAGRFLNWHHGLRRTIPRFVTLRRASHMLEIANRTNGIVHFWLHPENLATSPSTILLLKQLVCLIAKLRDAGTCKVLTQLDYCRDFQSRVSDISILESAQNNVSWE